MEITSSIVRLQPGMYILRHPKGGLPPLTVSRAPSSAATHGKLEILSTPKTHGTILSDGADCIVMYIGEAPVDLLVTAYPTHVGAVIPSIKIDQIGLDAEITQAAAPTTAVSAAIPLPVHSVKPIEIGPKGLSIVGHIERTGDVVASEGQYLGEMASNLRLEGFQVMWPDRPEGVDLAYGVAMEGVGTTPTVTTGKFCGSRNEARRITEVTFALIGPQAEKFQLEGHAHFSGGFQVPVSSGMPLSGPSGLEHLTAISLRAIPSTQPRKKLKNPWDESPQTQVFKAKTTSTPAPTQKPEPKKTVSRAAKAKQV